MSEMRSQPETVLSEAEKQHLRAALDAAGCRFTRQRAAVYSYLKRVETHPTAEEVFHAVRPVVPNISLATVYKSLEALVTAKLALKLHLGDGPARYDARTEHHYHLRCTRTGQVRDLALAHDPDLPVKLGPQLQAELHAARFKLADYRLELIGEFETLDRPR